jgi:hypothetical protein
MSECWTIISAGEHADAVRETDFLADGPVVVVNRSLRLARRFSRVTHWAIFDSPKVRPKIATWPHRWWPERHLDVFTQVSCVEQWARLIGPRIRSYGILPGGLYEVEPSEDGAKQFKNVPTIPLLVNQLPLAWGAKHIRVLGADMAGDMGKDWPGRWEYERELFQKMRAGWLDRGVLVESFIPSHPLSDLERRTLASLVARCQPGDKIEVPGYTAPSREREVGEPYLHPEFPPVHEDELPPETPPEPA